MPWDIRQNFGSCSGFAVVKRDNDEVEGCHDTRDQAEAQLAALNASEADSNDNPTMNAETEEEKRRRRARQARRPQVQGYSEVEYVETGEPEFVPEPTFVPDNASER